MSRTAALTTFDNPFDPFDQFDEWNLFDVEHRYNSCSRLARIAKVSDDMTQKEIDEAIENAIDEIIKYDITNAFKKVTRDIKEQIIDDGDIEIDTQDS